MGYLGVLSLFNSLNTITASSKNKRSKVWLEVFTEGDSYSYFHKSFQITAYNALGTICFVLYI